MKDLFQKNEGLAPVVLVVLIYTVVIFRDMIARKKQERRLDLLSSAFMELTLFIPFKAKGESKQTKVETKNLDQLKHNQEDLEKLLPVMMEAGPNIYKGKTKEQAMEILNQEVRNDDIIDSIKRLMILSRAFEALGYRN